MLFHTPALYADEPDFHIGSVSSEGTITFSGSCVSSPTFTLSTDGTITFSGSCDSYPAYIQNGEGEIVLSGDCVSYPHYRHNGNGTLDIGGFSLNRPIYRLTITSITRVDPTAFKIAWETTAPAPLVFRVYVGGVLVASIPSSTSSASTILHIGAGDSPFVEVLDNACSLPAIAFSGRITLNWEAITGTAVYSVLERIGLSYSERQRFPATNAANYRFETRWLEDCTEHDFRVIPYASDGTAGDNMDFSVLMVRHPDVPDVEFSYDAETSLLTVG